MNVIDPRDDAFRIGQRPVLGNVRGWVHSVEAGGTADGPGVRFVLFLSGCPLRCKFCHNPDTWHMQDGKPTGSRDIIAEIKPYTRFLKSAGGGVTISGGEPLMQIDFTASILHGAKGLGLHTALDTSGALGHHVDDGILADIDLVLLDIKAIDDAAYTELTGARLRQTLAFAERLADIGKPIWLRYVLVPGLTDDAAQIDKLAAYAAKLEVVERVDILPFHKMGEWKWQQLGLPYTLTDTNPPEPGLVDRTRAIFRAHGLTSPA